MSPEQWKLARELFDQLSGQDPAARARILDKACASDPELRRELEELLAYHDTQGPLDAPETVDTVPKVEREFEIGQVVGNRFRVLSFISHGGMGAVYRAEDLELHTQVALKVLRRAISNNESMIARFRREVLMARRVTHPNVCRLHDIARHDETGGGTIYFLTMELIEGETLADRLARKGALAPAAILPVVRQVTSGLAAAHDAGVIHRDLKPGNIMLTGEGVTGRAVITDFGLAYTNAEGGHSVAVIGTPAYMAPEQLEGQPATPRSDLYSLGVVMYQMLSGHLPSREASRPSGDYPSSMPPHWARVIEQSLSRDPAKRPASAQEFLDGLEGVGAPLRLGGATRPWHWIVGAAIAAAPALILWWHPWSRTLKPDSDAQAWVAQAVAAINNGVYTTAEGMLKRAALMDPDSPVVHARLAEVYTELELWDRAREEILAAITKAQDRPVDVADRLLLDGTQLTVNRDLKKALEKYRQLAGLSRSASSLVELGRAYERAGDRPKAASAYQSALTNDSQNPAAMLRLGVLDGRNQEYQRAREALDHAAGIFEDSRNIEGVAETLYQQGVVLSDSGKLDDAQRGLERCISLVETIQDAPHQVRCLLQLGVVRRRLGDPKSAGQYAKRAIEKAQATGNEPLAEFGLLDLGNLALASSDYSEAEAYFKKALEWAEREKMPRVRARAQLCLASLRNQQSQYQEALEFTKPAGQWFDQNGFGRQARQSKMLMAEAYEGMGEPSRAMPVLDEVLADAKLAGDARLELDAIPRRADILADWDRYPEALADYQAATKLAESLNQRESQMLQAINSADMLWRLGRFVEAERALGKVILSSDRVRDRVGLVRASMLVARLQPQLALRALSGTLRSKDDDTRLRAGCLTAMAKAQRGESGRLESCLAELPSKVELRMRTDAALASVLGLMLSHRYSEAAAKVNLLLPQIHALSQPESKLRLLSMGQAAGQATAAQSASYRELQTTVQKMFGDDWRSYARRPDVARFMRTAP